MADSKWQKTVFLESEGDGWYQRNKAAPVIVKEDLVIGMLSSHRITPSSILDIGASGGQRLTELKTLYPDAHLSGIEPSAEAVRSAAPEFEMVQGTADRLPWRRGNFDLIIFGFCLCLCDREDLFVIAAEADRVLNDGGHIVIQDFHVSNTYRNAWSHFEGLHTYKMDYSRMFSWNPAYRVAAQNVTEYSGSTVDKHDNRSAVTLLRKHQAAGWPDNPEKR